MLTLRVCGPGFGRPASGLFRRKALTRLKLFAAHEARLETRPFAGGPHPRGAGASAGAAFAGVMTSPSPGSSGAERRPDRSLQVWAARRRAHVATIASPGPEAGGVSDNGAPGAAGPPDPFARDASDRRGVRVSLPVLDVREGERTWRIGAILRAPDAAPPAGGFAAVVIVHGSNGLDSRGEAYARALNAAGMASLEIDLWTARGVVSPQTRPRSPAETLPDAFAALAYLQGRPEISPGRIGLMGFSWGGVVTMLAATRRAQETFGADRPGFAGFAPFYPVCWAYNTAPGLAFGELVDRPVLIQAGARDLYDDPDSCERLAASLSAEDRAHVSVITHPDATHAWDRREPDMVAMDPFSHKGAGGPTPFVYNQEATRRSTAAVTAFFTSALGPD